LQQPATIDFGLHQLAGLADERIDHEESVTCRGA
jgi:hypothetical protein